MTQPTGKTQSQTLDQKVHLKKELSSRTSAVVISLIILVIGLCIYQLTGRPTSSEGPSSQFSNKQLAENAKWWEEAARQSGGNFNRLSAVDQKRGEDLAGDRPKAMNTLYGVYRSQAIAEHQNLNAPPAGEPPAFIQDLLQRKAAGR